MTSDVTINKRVRTGPVRTNIAGATQRNKLTVRGKEPGYHYHIIKADEPGRLDELLERGYEVVTHKISIGDARVDNSNPEGSAQTVELGGPITGHVKGIVVRIKQDWYDEDQKIVTDAAAAQAESTLSPNSVEGGYGTIERTDKRV